MNILITICARAGSKGIKNKNLQPLLGKALIAHTIDQAGRWGRASEIVVSTDSPEIAETAKKYGALVPFIRPQELASDEAPKIPSIRHALLQSESIFEKEYPIVVDLDPTAPIRTIADLENCYQRFLKEKPKTLFSVVAAHKNPYFNMIELDSSERAHLCKTIPSEISRRQDVPPVYNLNASIYFYQREYLLDETNRGAISDDSRIYVMDELSAHDIDREIDFKFIEFLVKEGMVPL